MPSWLASRLHCFRSFLACFSFLLCLALRCLSRLTRLVLSAFLAFLSFFFCRFSLRFSFFTLWSRFSHDSATLPGPTRPALPTSGPAGGAEGSGLHSSPWHGAGAAGKPPSTRASYMSIASSWSEAASRSRLAMNRSSPLGLALANHESSEPDRPAEIRWRLPFCFHS